MSIFYDSLYSVFLFNMVLGLDFLGLALSRSPRWGRPDARSARARRARAAKVTKIVQAWPKL
jgi:hypothetical protein